MNRIVVGIVLFLTPFISYSQHSIAREFNEVLLEGIRNDLARPTVHARNLFHASVLMYDAWAIYHDGADPYLYGQTVHGFGESVEAFDFPDDLEAATEEAIAYAMYRFIRHRYQSSPDWVETEAILEALMTEKGYDTSIVSVDYTTGDPAHLGNYLAFLMIQYGLQDGSNESNEYANQYYSPSNEPLVMKFEGNPDITDPNRWQPLVIDVFIDQSGNEVPGGSREFLSPEWGDVNPFSMTESDKTTYTRDDDTYHVYHDPGAPWYIDPVNGGLNTEAYQWGFSLVSIWSAHLSGDDDTMWDISPGAIGNVDTAQWPTTFEEYQTFYNLIDGGDVGTGHDMNPSTGTPYPANMVRRGDYARILAEFWADGPDSETPPGHWFSILNYVMDHPQFERRYRGEGDILDVLEYDVKAYFALGGAMHDCAIAAWSVKGWYDYLRPVSAIRYMCERGQSTDPALPNYDVAGLPLIDGLIELVEEGDPLVNAQEDIGKIKLYTWRGPDYISDPETDAAGVGWILAENWWPYQRPSFVTPPFAGYVSGHSTYSRAAAEVLTLLTGDPYFPGGVGEFFAPQNEFLVFEEGPSEDITLQWATYRDASDQTSLSRIWGGIHPPIDDIPGRRMGQVIGHQAFDFANQYFNVSTSATIPELEQVVASISPNPSKGQPSILRLPENRYIDRMEIYDASGKMIHLDRVLGSRKELELPDVVNQAILIVKLYGDDWTSTERWVKLD